MLVHLQLRKNRTIFGNTAVPVCCKWTRKGNLRAVTVDSTWGCYQRCLIPKLLYFSCVAQSQWDFLCNPKNHCERGIYKACNIVAINSSFYLTQPEGWLQWIIYHLRHNILRHKPFLWSPQQAKENVVQANLYVRGLIKVWPVPAI